MTLRATLAPAVVGLLAFTGAAFAEVDADPLVRLSAGEPHYFEEESSEDATFVELRSDGTYRTIDRVHLGVSEDDAGRWRQTATGTLLLCSSHRFGVIESGGLWVSVVDREIYDQLPDLRDVIRRLLATHKEEFAEAAVEWPFGKEDYHRNPSASDVVDSPSVA
jgi:hypothetical protein